MPLFSAQGLSPPPYLGAFKLLARLNGVNGALAGDQAIPVNYAGRGWGDLAGQGVGLLFTNASAVPVALSGGLYTAPAKGGTLLMASNTVFTSMASAAFLYKPAFVAAQAALLQTVRTIYFNPTTINAAALTMDFFMYATDFPN